MMHSHLLIPQPNERETEMTKENDREQQRKETVGLGGRQWEKHRPGS